MLKERPWKTVRPPVSTFLIGIGGGTEMITRQGEAPNLFIYGGGMGRAKASVQTSMIHHDLRACPDLVWIRGADIRLGTVSALQSGPGGAWYSNETRFRPTRRDQQGDYPQDQAHVHPSISYCVNPKMR